MLSYSAPQSAHTQPCLFLTNLPSLHRGQWIIFTAITWKKGKKKKLNGFPFR